MMIFDEEFLSLLRLPGVCFILGTLVVLFTPLFWPGVLVIIVGFVLIVVNPRVKQKVFEIHMMLQAGKHLADTASMLEQMNLSAPVDDSVKSEVVIDVQQEKKFDCCYECYLSGKDLCDHK